MIVITRWLAGVTLSVLLQLYRSGWGWLHQYRCFRVIGIGCNCSVVASRADGVRMFLSVVRDSVSEAVASTETLQWLKAEVDQL